MYIHPTFNQLLANLMSKMARLLAWISVCNHPKIKIKLVINLIVYSDFLCCVKRTWVCPPCMAIQLSYGPSALPWRPASLIGNKQLGPVCMHPPPPTIPYNTPHIPPTTPPSCPKTPRVQVKSQASKKLSNKNSGKESWQKTEGGGIRKEKKNKFSRFTFPQLLGVAP